MENNNYRDEFEHFLKESSDEFRMVPSRRVWYSIYNDMHPDRRWPSMAVCLLILSAVLYIGVSNNNSLSDAARRSKVENFSIAQNNNGSKTTDATNAVAGIGSHHPAMNNGDERNDLPEGMIDEDNVTENSINTDLTNDPLLIVTELNGKNNIIANTGSPDTDETYTTAAKLRAFVNRGETDEDGNTASGDKTLHIAKTTELTTIVTLQNNNDIAEKNKIAAAEKLKLSIAADNDKAWREDYAFRNKPAINKFKERASINYYVTPSVGYRDLIQQNNASAAATANMFRMAATNYNTDDLTDMFALNLEAGAALQYKITKALRLKGGLQANYTNYVSKATELGHPTQTFLAVNNDVNAMRSSVYSTAAGSARLNKSTLQISMPLGADLKIAGTDRIKWYIGANIQPTYILNGNAFVLSSDAKNYISEGALLRKWNMNTAVETFVTFKPAAGVTLNVGPQFRYQLLSSYKKEYNYTEKLYNIGVKVGITTEF